jgi:hypothetical protein
VKCQRNRKVHCPFHDPTLGCLNQIDGIDGKGMQIVTVLSASDAGAEGLLKYRGKRDSRHWRLDSVHPCGATIFCSARFDSSATYDFRSAHTSRLSQWTRFGFAARRFDFTARWSCPSSVAVETFGASVPPAPLAAASAEAGDRSEAVVSSHDPDIARNPCI